VLAGWLKAEPAPGVYGVPVGGKLPAALPTAPRASATVLAGEPAPAVASVPYRSSVSTAEAERTGFVAFVAAAGAP
jgi:hypothetical protein